MENSVGAYQFAISGPPLLIIELIKSFFDRYDISFLILEHHDEDAETGELAENHALFCSPGVEENGISAAIMHMLPSIIENQYIGLGFAGSDRGFEAFVSSDGMISLFVDNYLQMTDLLSRSGFRHQKEFAIPVEENFYPSPSQKREASTVVSSLVEMLGMYPIDEPVIIFFSSQEQLMMDRCLKQHIAFSDYSGDDFEGFLAEWADFVYECEEGFEATIWDYNDGLNIRDLIEHIIRNVGSPLDEKIGDAIIDYDNRFDAILVDRDRNIDPPRDVYIDGDIPFWYRGIPKKYGTELRRDLIRCGWYETS